MELRLEGENYIDEGILAAVVYELVRLGAKEAGRYRVHPLEERAVLKFDNPQLLLQAIEEVKRKLLEIRSQICE